MNITAETLHQAFASGLDTGARIRVRRPSLFQVELPAFMGDGDGAAIYVRPGKNGSFVVTDLGSTRMRISYQRKPTGEIDEALSQLAELQGMQLEKGELRAEVGARDLLAATLGLLQVEAQAERLAVSSKRKTHEATAFRAHVLELLHRLFKGQVTEPYFDAKTDPEGLFKVDALALTKTPLAIALIPGDIDAERAVSAKLSLAKFVPAKTRWIAIPREMERLTSKTRQRLNREYFTAGSTFEEDRVIVEERLCNLADVA
jgi:Domain of unknown function DUF1828